MGREFTIGLWLWPLALADICALLLITLALHSPRVRAVWLWVILPQTAVVSAAAFLLLAGTGRLSGDDYHLRADKPISRIAGCGYWAAAS